MHIFMILSDELRADALGFMGNKVVKTPHLDRLAQGSVVFEQAYCNTPMCVPSRVSIATGRYAHSHGALDNMLRPLDQEVSFYNMLRDHGYRTFNHGKWHCNTDTDGFGISASRAGVEDLTVPEKYVTCFGITDAETRRVTPHKRNHGEVPLILSGKRPSHKDETLDSLVTLNYLKDLEAIDPTEGPVFARLSIMDPHTPYIPSEPYASMYDPKTLPMPVSMKENLKTKPVLQRYFQRVRGFDQLEEEDYRESKAAYYGLVSHVDDRVGAVIEKLKEKDLYEDSMIIFIADHGSMMGEHGFVEKWGHMYEEVMKIPLMIKLPKGAQGGKRLDAFVESVDVMPTILDYLGISIPEKVQGKSLKAYMSGRCRGHKEVVYGQYYCGSLQNTSALMVRDAKWKLTSYPEGNALEGFLLNDHPLKMTDMFDQGSVLGELYDMEADPNELENLFDHDAYADIKATYLDKLDQWIKGLGPIVKTETLPEHNPLSLHVIKQGENMVKAQEVLKGEQRLGQLKL